MFNVSIREYFSVLNVSIVCICNTARSKSIPLMCTHVDSYKFSTVHPPRITCQNTFVLPLQTLKSETMRNRRSTADSSAPCGNLESTHDANGADQLNIQLWRNSSHLNEKTLGHYNIFWQLLNEFIRSRTTTIHLASTWCQPNLSPVPKGALILLTIIQTYKTWYI
jgi:hypothetical protein